MKVINGIAYYSMNNKNVVFVSDDYKGSPDIYFKYDVLLCSQEIYNRFKNNLVADHLLNDGWIPDLKII